MPTDSPVAIESVMVYCTIMSPAKLLYRAKRTTRDGLLVEMVIWQLPEPTAERPHGLKYRLYCGLLDGTPVVRYDNETGKGDHRHYGDSEAPYHFIDVDTLMSDFLTDVAKATKEDE